ncbi:hypothetical protein BSKO_05804 [Bryopsis sp. KO-2023]|nr:hypothetical protein BSKO_05804 [Bryopsis sp. KO-2023]
MSSLLNISGLIAAVFLSALGPAVSVPECDFFKVEGGYLESVGDFDGDLKCSSYPSIHAAKEECRAMVACDGFSFGPWGSGVGGCLKMNRKGGFTTNPEYVGYHKTLMGCCGDDKLEKAQCHVQEVRHVDKRVLGGKRVEKLVSRANLLRSLLPTTKPNLAHKGQSRVGPSMETKIKTSIKGKAVLLQRAPPTLGGRSICWMITTFPGLR